MLSYMLPVEEKPPAGKERLQLELTSPPPSSPEGRGGRAGGAGGAGGGVGAGRPPVAPPPPPPSVISKESSTSSFASSDLTTGSSMTPTGTSGGGGPHDKPKHKLLANGNKHTTLKRVSFGSSKGSMVETLIYESPLAEEPEGSPAPATRPHETSFSYTSSAVSAAAAAAAAAAEADAERSKVRVSFYQGARPQCVSPPPPQPGSAEQDSHALLAALLAAASDADMASAATANVVDAAQPLYNRQISTESGWDNPFRPDGDLSREADEIVSLIKGGKPITPTPGAVVAAAAAQLPSVDEVDDKHHANSLSVVAPESPASKAASPKLSATPSPKGNVNGTKNGSAVEARPGQVEVQRTAPPEPQQAEHIVLKKKPKCECCVLQ